MNPMPWSYVWFIPLLPFAGFLINGTLGRRLPRVVVSTVASALHRTACCARRVAVDDDVFHGRAEFHRFDDPALRI